MRTKRPARQQSVGSEYPDDMSNPVAPLASRHAVIVALHEVLQRDNTQSRCCAVRALATVGADDEESCKRLIGLLLDQDPDVRMDAVVALGRMKVEQAVLPLLENLEKDPEGEIRIEVVKALSSIRSPQAVERLIRCFKEDGYPELDYQVDDLEFNACWEVQSIAMDALATIGDSRAVEPLIEVLESEGYEDLQESGYRALARLSSGSARKFLLTQLKQGEALARRRAARALAAIPELRIGAESATREIPPDILNGLTNALVDTDAAVRIYAAQALGASADPAAVVPVTLLLDDPDMEVRSEAAEILAAIQGREIVDRLHQLLTEKDRDLSRRIVRVLGDIGEPASLDAVGLLLDSPDGDLVYEAVGALGKIGAAGPEQKLADILSEQGNHYTLRMQAALALGSLLAALSEHNVLEQEHRPQETVEETGVPQATPEKTPHDVLEQAVFAEDERVACAALEAMVEMDPDDAASSLVQILTGRWGIETPAQSGIGQELDPGLAENPAEADPGDEIPQELPQELVEMVTGRNAGNSTLAAILAARPASNDASAEREEDADEGGSVPRQPQPGVRVLAARLLGNLPKPGPAAVAALIAACDKDDPEMHREAIRGLGHSGDKAAMEPILAGLGAEQENVRLAALDALGNVTGANSSLNKLAWDKLAWDKTAWDRMFGMLEDPAPAIRQRVVENMTSLRGPEVAEKLCRALEDEDLGVCRAALNALSRENFTLEQARQIEKLMFRFSCELRKESAAALRRMDDFSAVPRLLDRLNDMEQESCHWGCIDALAEMVSMAETLAENSEAGDDI